MMLKSCTRCTVILLTNYTCCLWCHFFKSWTGSTSCSSKTGQSIQTAGMSASFLSLPPLQSGEAWNDPHIRSATAFNRHNRPQHFVACGCSQLWGHIHDGIGWGTNGEHSWEKCEEQVPWLLNWSMQTSSTKTQPTSRYGNLWLCSVRPSFCQKQNHSSQQSQCLSSTLVILLLLKHSIRLLHTTHGQTRKIVRQRRFGLKCSITKTAVETKCSKNLPSFCLWAMLM